MRTRSGTGRGHRVFAALHPRMARAVDASPVGDARRALLADAEGVVVDVGAGTGENLPHLGPRVGAVHLVEPDRFMVERLPADLPSHVEVHRVGAEDLPLPDASADTVLLTLVLCSTPDAAGVLREVRRVVRPGGRVLVLEHVRSPDPRLARRQDRLGPLWGLVMGGCHPGRDTLAALAAAGFGTADLRRFRVPEMTFTPDWVTGRLT